MSVPTRGIALLLNAFGLPRLPLQVQSTGPQYDDLTERWLDASHGWQPPDDTATYLRWLATHRDVLFHGSQRADLDQLTPDRESGDSTAFGNQRAVFATDDPIWAMWFALLNRSPGYRSTRNGAWSVRGGHDRHYFFSVDSDQPDADLLTPGWLYVLPRSGFTRERPAAGLVQSGQWINPNPVRPIAHLPVSPTDFPFPNHVHRHTPRTGMLRTLWNRRRPT
ncbi:hypothetical protein E0H75_27945 [Kribbella capetownensis]|uniref:Uncharacterized protein n=1 Tax=Kribbella capetownensis TaxID=1572659 RepID=A0A4R0JIP8_9ACTN|nr:hypothetical protein [Kribbella capetownensis]TCC46871.1 hypothetical protein E0H75_27945 [Kribbella capetownensis]